MKLKALTRYSGWPEGMSLHVEEGTEFDVPEPVARYLLNTFPAWFKNIEESPLNKMVKVSKNK